MEPDWSEFALDAADVKKQVGIQFKGEGWYAKKGDYMLIAAHAGGFMCHCWNGRDPRPEMRRLADLPQHS